MMRPTAAQVKQAWDAIRKPSARIVADAMKAEGFDINYRTVTRYKEKDWAEPGNTARVSLKPSKTAKQSLKNLAKGQIAANSDLQTRILNVSEPNIDVRIARMRELYLRSVPENQATLQQAGIIAAIIVSEEMLATMGHLILYPADLARLLSAITEASQVKHVSGQAPGDGAKTIDAEPVKTTDVRDAVNRFKRAAGLTV